MTASEPTRPTKRVVIIAGEASGDALGAALISALRRRSDATFEIAGIGGDQMIAVGIDTPFHVSDVAVMGIIAIAGALPRLIRRVYEAVDFAVDFRPDCVVIIDSPEFTHPIAHRIRKRLPHVPIIDYVSPSVWAWRSGRARKMVGTIDKVLGLLPFEPAAYERLKGPPCVYVGHPLIEQIDRFQPSAARAEDPRTILILPGSRTSEITKLMPVFRPAIERFDDQHGERVRWVLPTVSRQRDRLNAMLEDWSVPVVLQSTRDEQVESFRQAHMALAASGTVTLELSLAAVPMVVCYRIDPIIAAFRSLLRAHSVVLPNLIAGGNTVPELIHTDCTPDAIHAWMTRLWDDGPDRWAQGEVFARVAAELKKAGASPSDAAADEVIKTLRIRD